MELTHEQLVAVIAAILMTDYWQPDAGMLANIKHAVSDARLITAEAHKQEGYDDE